MSQFSQANPGQGPTYDLGPDSQAAEPQGIAKVTGEHIVPRATNIEPLELVQDEGSSFESRPTRGEFMSFVTKVGGDSYKDVIAKLSPADAVVLVREAFSFLDRIESAACNPHDLLLLETHRAELAEKCAAEIQHAVKLCSGLFKDPAAIISTFAADAAARINGREKLSGLQSDQLDRARLTLILGAGVGLREEDTAFGNKSEESRDKTVEKEAKGVLSGRLSPEEKEARRLERIAKLKEGTKAAAPAEPQAPQASEEQEKSAEQEASAQEAQERRDRLEDSRPSAAHAAYRQLLPQSLPEEVMRSMAPDMRRGALAAFSQQKVYEVGDALVTWARSEIAFSGSKAMLSNATQTTQRAEQLRAKLDPKIKEEAQIVTSLKKVLKCLAKQLPADAEALRTLGLKLKEITKLEVLTAEGMKMIRHDTPTISEAVIRDAQRAQLKAQEARAAEREGWKNDRWAREGLDRPVGDV